MGSDYNGDGHDDILWLNWNGALSTWLGQDRGGFTINDANALAHVDPFWEVLGSGDFNGDLRDDLLWISDASEISNWLGTDRGGFVVNDAYAYVPWSANWIFAGIGDFNGDGRDDILWSNYDRQVSIWSGRTNGGFTQNTAIPVPTDSNSWFVSGTGDFNGDGCDDILWRSHTGALTNWLGTDVGGFVINDATAFAKVPLGWYVAGTGDYDGDGHDDILWRHANGAVSDWLGTDSGGWIINDTAAYAQVEPSWIIGSNYNPWDDGFS